MDLSNAKIINVEAWKRYKQYLFFKDFESPFFNICTSIDVTELKQYCSSNNVSFLIRLLFDTLTVANQIPQFKYRLSENGVVEFDQIDTGTTVLTNDETFNFCYLDFHKDFAKFNENAIIRIEESKSDIEKFEPQEQRIDLLHISSIPWTSFSSISHARNFNTKDSVPKLVFGKYYQNQNRWMLPLSVEVHHALVDGVHVGRFLAQLQTQINTLNSN